LPTAALTSEQIKDLYVSFTKAEQWKDWKREYLTDLQWASQTSDSVLVSVEGQTRLWKLRGLGSAGPSENIDVKALAADETLAKRLVALRGRTWDAAPAKRAVEIQEAYGELLADVRAHQLSNTPMARLRRAMHAMLPDDLHCCYKDDAQIAVRNLLAAQRNRGVIGDSVLARARLRDALGPEANLAESVRRSTFCWWLYENVDTISAGKVPALPPGGGKESAPVAPPLAIWEFARQHRWFQPFQGGVDTMRVMLREAINGLVTTGLVEALKDELEGGGATVAFVAKLTRYLLRLGFLEERDGRYITTASGEALLEADPPDPLIEAMIVRVAGFGAMLRHLETSGNDPKSLLESMRPYCQDRSVPSFTSYLLWWAGQTGLMTSGRVLSDIGRAWVARLPTEIEIPSLPKVGSVGPGIEDPKSSGAALEYPSFSELWDTLSLDDGGFVLDRDHARAIHVAWTFHARKRFAILSGLSGTGKTQILLRLANAICKRLNLEPKAHIALVPVRPDWRDPTGLLGYFNALHAEPTFQPEPALRLAIAASRNPGKPYFLLLDEMNLAPVERYFAPFLSAMESGMDLVLHAGDAPINDVPTSIPWPSNLRIGGTVNMDETTHSFSDKVLDRAFTIELWEVDLDAFLRARPRRSADDAPVEAALTRLNALLRPVRRHFGYRTAGEVLDWVGSARTQDPTASPAALLDQAVFSKVLPRLRGSDSTAWVHALEQLEKCCKETNLLRSSAKLADMRAQLGEAGASGFWS
jgi:hypothetical protein